MVSQHRPFLITLVFAVSRAHLKLFGGGEKDETVLHEWVLPVQKDFAKLLGTSYRAIYHFHVLYISFLLHIMIYITKYIP